MLLDDTLFLDQAELLFLLWDLSGLALFVICDLCLLFILCDLVRISFWLNFVISSELAFICDLIRISFCLYVAL